MAVRKSATQMTDAEKQRFRDVITQLIQNGTYGQLVSHHANMMHNMHSSMGFVGRQRFLPWHRVYLLRLEEAMQAIDSLSFIPYWGWTTQRWVPPWLSNFRPTVNVPGQGNIAVARNVGAPPPLPTGSDVSDVLSETTYTDFTTQLEFIHNDVHGWVGGTMSLITTSPADPLFWLHHAQVDRLWSQWQAKSSNAGKNPILSGNNRIMDPWPETAAQVRSITSLGYSYS
jgi:tyrosinase